MHSPLLIVKVLFDLTFSCSIYFFYNDQLIFLRRNNSPTASECKWYLGVASIMCSLREEPVKITKEVCRDKLQVRFLKNVQAKSEN